MSRPFKTVPYHNSQDHITTFLLHIHEHTLILHFTVLWGRCYCGQGSWVSRQSSNRMKVYVFAGRLRDKLKLRPFEFLTACNGILWDFPATARVWVWISCMQEIPLFRLCTLYPVVHSVKACYSQNHHLCIFPRKLRGSDIVTQKIP